MSVDWSAQKNYNAGVDVFFPVLCCIHGGISVIQPHIGMEYLPEGFDCSVNNLIFVTVVQKCWRLQIKRVITDAMTNSNATSWEQRHPVASLWNSLGSIARGRLASVGFKEDRGLLKNLDWEGTVRMCNQTPWACSPFNSNSQVWNCW